MIILNQFTGVYTVHCTVYGCMTYVLHRIREKIGRNGKKNIKPFKKGEKRVS